MLRIFITSYHILIATLAVSLLLVLIFGVSFFLAEGLLAYFFGIDLFEWIHQTTGFDLRAILT